MRKALRWRYYCEHCKKAGGSGGHMARHERGCTANPARVCNMCAIAGFTPQSLTQLVSFVQQHTNWDAFDESCPCGGISKEHLEELRKLADGCPVCMFAALRQGKAYPNGTDFDFKAELRSVWDDVNSAREAANHAY